MICSLPRGTGGCLSTPGLCADRCEAWEHTSDIKDFDGDALNMTLCLDHLVAKEFEGFKPHFNLFKMDKPLKPSGTAYISKPLAGALSEFFDSH